MEIGSAYALQVCLLQIPALVLYSAVYGRFIDPVDLVDHTFKYVNSESRSQVRLMLIIIFQSDFSTVGYGHRHSLCFPSKLYLQ